jgi:selenide,water dikinase
MEMLVASDVAADLTLAQVPLLPGAAALLSEGLESTLAAANRAVESDIERPGSATAPAYLALFDPQTCGGFLLSVPDASADAALTRLHGLGCDTAATIGAVVAAGSGRRRLRVL